MLIAVFHGCRFITDVAGRYAVCVRSFAGTKVAYDAGYIECVFVKRLL